ncbi:MAG: bifunctional folylpolyglutamate synthase/dihydrofolate synthase [Ignavibacteria bacterium]|nr:bifunctional folylpolyglutamate synthase/dihydrofolate synthase [Ignavibacteria bacterium]
MKKFRDYNKCINFLFGLERVGIKYSLNNIKVLLKYFGNPEKGITAIHIAGTNGKGSVASMINSILIEHGFKCGLYTSPHIFDFRERILVNRKFIEKEYILDCTNDLLNLIEKISPSFFEVTTAIAFKYFRDKKLDFAIVEAGLGGRLDSTNVLKPILTIITGISIDHTEYLGNTINKIAYEKSGIIKRNTPLILGKINNKVIPILVSTAKAKNANIVFSTKEHEIRITRRTEEGFYFNLINKNFKLTNVFLPLVGDFQKWNTLTSLSAINKLSDNYHVKIKEESIINGLKNIKYNSRFYGRFEKIKENPKIVIDVSHNLEGIKNIEKNLKYFTYDNLYIIFTMMSDKKYKNCIKELEKIDSKIIVTKSSNKRAIEPELLIENVKEKNKFIHSRNVREAFYLAKKFANKQDLILLTGSFYLISDFLKVLKNKYN